VHAALSRFTLADLVKKQKEKTRAACAGSIHWL
jgi:hypothetical protein